MSVAEPPAETEAPPPPALEIPPVGFSFDEPEELYHANRKNFLTSSSLKEFRKCPKRFRKLELGEIKPKESDALSFGSAFDLFIFDGPTAFEEKIAWESPVNPRNLDKETGEPKPYGNDTNKFKEWKAEQDQSGKVIISRWDVGRIKAMARALREHPVASELVFGPGESQAVARAELDGVPCQIRIDRLPIYRDQLAILDVKTSAQFDQFPRKAKYEFGYLHQLAFYQLVLRQTYLDQKGVDLGFLLPLFVVVDCDKPNKDGGRAHGFYRVQVYEVDELLMQSYRTEIMRNIAELKECRARDHWPDRCQETKVID